MRNSLLLLFLFFLVANTSAAVGDFSDKDKAVIYTHSLNLLQEYQRLINEMGEYAISNPEASQSSAESFLELFVNRQVLIYNDLDPAHNLSAFYEAETYISNLKLWYPDGMRVNLGFEDAKVGNIMQHEDEIFSLDIMLTKRINGNYLNRSQNSNSEEILFRVAFNKKTGGFSNYKIVGIRNSDATMIPDFNKNLDEVNSEEMDENDLFKVSEGMRAVMLDYVNYIALLGDAEELEEDKEFYRESFSGLFEDEQVKVYNDLDPDPEKSLISVDEYLTSLAANYIQGIKNISMPVDSATIGKAIKTEEGNYYSTLQVDKFFSGNFQEKEAFRKAFPLNVKIRFDKSGNAFTNFKIQSIDIEADDFYQADAGAEAEELPTMQITTVTRKGISLEIDGSYGFSFIENQILNSLSLDYDYHTWQSTPKYGMKAGINAYFFFNDHFSLKTGGSYNTYENLFSLNGRFTDQELSRDLNDVQINKIIDANYDSTVSVANITIPLVFNYTSSAPGKLGFFIEAGAVIGYNLSASYQCSGTYEYLAYYPTHAAGQLLAALDDYLDYEHYSALGYYKDENINRSGDIPVSGLNIAAYGSLGLNISLGYFSSLKIGPEVYYGFSDFDQGRTQTDIFGKELIKLPTVLKKYSLKLSYILKL
ncbi:outer membrane beta-barrel protein [Bacteroidota bacterium]